MSSALDLLPDYVVKQIKMSEDERKWKHPGLRPDLTLIPEAEAKGWVVTFHNDHWHNTADFTKEQVHVWWIHVGNLNSAWRAADLIDGRYCNHRTYKTLKEALDE